MRAFTLLLLLAPSLCVAGQQRENAASARRPANGVSAPLVDPKTFVIGPQDVLVIRVYGEPDLSGPAAVRPDGKISLPLIEEIAAAGATPEQLSRMIARRLAVFVMEPAVTVAVQQVNSKKYYIAGEVNTPGTYPLVAPLTVLQALSNAGGFLDFAKRKRIFILRGSKRIPFNYSDVIKGKRMEQNIYLEPGDQIIVP